MTLLDKDGMAIKENRRVFNLGMTYNIPGPYKKQRESFFKYQVTLVNHETIVLRLVDRHQIIKAQEFFKPNHLFFVDDTPFRTGFCEGRLLIAEPLTKEQVRSLEQDPDWQDKIFRMRILATEANKPKE